MCLDHQKAPAMQTSFFGFTSPVETSFCMHKSNPLMIRDHMNQIIRIPLNYNKQASCFVAIQGEVINMRRPHYARSLTL